MMQLTVLVDNNTLIDQYYLGEPALCFHLVDGEHTLLFDTGYSDVFIRNAPLLGLDLAAVSTIALSHGHNDHTRGLQFWRSAGLPACRLVAHPHALLSRTAQGLEIGCPCDPEELRRTFVVDSPTTPTALSERLLFLGEIPRVHDFEPLRAMGTLRNGAEEQDDLLLDDTALVYRGEDGLFIITGCSHSGICNIIEYAKKVCGDTRVQGVIGGFHLLETSPRLTRTIEYFVRNNVRLLYPCHCVSFAAKAEMHSRIPVQEVGVGLRLNIA